MKAGDLRVEGCCPACRFYQLKKKTQGDPIIDPNFLALFVEAEGDGTYLTKLSCQAFVLVKGPRFGRCGECRSRLNQDPYFGLTDSDQLLDEIQYFRLDYHPAEPGKLFAEPMPHLHVDPDANVRCGFRAQPDTLLPDFIEWLYLNFRYETWEQWAKDVWQERAQPDHKPLDLFQQAKEFQSNYAGFLDRYAQPLKNLRTYLYDYKKDWLKMPPWQDRLLWYPGTQDEFLQPAAKAGTKV